MASSRSGPVQEVACKGSPYPPLQLAQFDGFADVSELVAWMTETYALSVRLGSLRLVLISWDPRRPWEVE